MLLDKLEKKGLISPPPFVIYNCTLLCITGSVSYGVADTNKNTDLDIVGICIPPKGYIFPATRGEIAGFGTPGPKFDQWQQHHIMDKDAHAGRGQEYDFSVFNIVKFFELCRGGNPNLIDFLFVRNEHVLHITDIGTMIRDNRKLFISKEIWAKFRGYCASQIHKAQKCCDNPETEQILIFEQEHGIPRTTRYVEVEQEFDRRKQSLDYTTNLSDLTDTDFFAYKILFENGTKISKRFEDRKVTGQDSKYLYHLLRLLDEAQQLLETGEMDIQRSRETLKAVRRGEWSMEEVIKWTTAKERELDVVFTNCKLPAKADEAALKKLLLSCLEQHYGNLSDVIVNPDASLVALRNIQAELDKVKNIL